jgi:hypothetical protein
VSANKEIVNMVSKDDIDALEELKSTQQTIYSSIESELKALQARHKALEIDSEQQKAHLVEAILTKDKLMADKSEQFEILSKVPDPEEDSESVSDLQKQLQEKVDAAWASLLEANEVRDNHISKSRHSQSKATNRAHLTKSDLSPTSSMNKEPWLDVESIAQLFHSELAAERMAIGLGFRQAPKSGLISSIGEIFALSDEEFEQRYDLGQSASISAADIALPASAVSLPLDDLPTPSDVIHAPLPRSPSSFTTASSFVDAHAEPGPATQGVEDLTIVTFDLDGWPFAPAKVGSFLSLYRDVQDL